MRYSNRIFWSILVLLDVVIFGILFAGMYTSRDYSFNQKEKSYLIGDRKSGV